MKPLIDIINYRENSDGSADITFEYDNRLKKIVLGCYKLKRITKKDISSFLKEAIANYIDTNRMMLREINGEISLARKEEDIKRRKK